MLGMCQTVVLSEEMGEHHPILDPLRQECRALVRYLPHEEKRALCLDLRMGVEQCSREHKTRVRHHLVLRHFHEDCPRRR